MHSKYHSLTVTGAVGRGKLKDEKVVRPMELATAYELLAQVSMQESEGEVRLPEEHARGIPPLILRPSSLRRNSSLFVMWLFNKVIV